MMIPEPGSRWKHANGTIYHVVLIANEHATKPSYPVTIVYSANGKIWSRPLENWHNSMQEISND